MDKLFNLKGKEEKEWEGMPEFDNEDLEKKGIKLIVNFLNEKDLQDFSKLINQKITKKTKFIYFPKLKNIPFKNKLYISKKI